VVDRDKRGFVPLRKTSKNRIWDCGLLGSTHRIVFGGEKSRKQLRSSRGMRHDDDDTVVERCKHIATQLGQHHVVLTVDEALYCKLMELKRAKDEYQNFLIVRMGGLHISLNFLKVIGKHLQSSGLLEAWIESKILGPGTAELVLAGKGKSYSKAMRAHKLTIQALWKILMPKLLTFIRNEAQGLRAEIEAKENNEDIEELLLLLTSNDFRDTMSAFFPLNACCL